MGLIKDMGVTIMQIDVKHHIYAVGGSVDEYRSWTSGPCCHLAALLDPADIFNSVLPVGVLEFMALQE
jgi:hypothetical protein